MGEKKCVLFLETNVNKNAHTALDGVCIAAHMSSPRTRDFYKQLAGSIRAERALLDGQREAAAVELRALQGRLYRLNRWEEICKQIERLQLWERHAIN